MRGGPAAHAEERPVVKLQHLHLEVRRRRLVGTERRAEAEAVRVELAHALPIRRIEQIAG